MYVKVDKITVRALLCIADDPTIGVKHWQMGYTIEL